MLKLENKIKNQNFGKETSAKRAGYPIKENWQNFQINICA